MNKTGIGLIGCGARIRYGIIKYLMDTTDKVEVLSVYDPDENNARETVDLYNPSAKICNSYNQVINDSRISWVFIGSWNCSHAEQAIKSFEAGKHVFCEKPLATNIDDCIAVRDAWKRSDKTSFFGFALRYSKFYQKLRRIINSGKIGKIMSLEFNETLTPDHGGYIHSDWRRKTEYAGSHLLEKCCHDIDIVNWFVDSLPKRMASFGGNDFFIPENERLQKVFPTHGNGKPAFQGHRYAFSNPFKSDKNIVDNQVAIIEYYNHTRATFHTNCATAIPRRRIYICGNEGTIDADATDLSIQVKRFYGKMNKMTVKSLPEKSPHFSSTNPASTHYGGDVYLGKELAAVIVSNKKPSVNVDNGLISALTCFGIDEALNSGRIVEMEPFWRKAAIFNSF